MNQDNHATFVESVMFFLSLLLAMTFFTLAAALAAWWPLIPALFFSLIAAAIFYRQLDQEDQQ